MDAAIQISYLIAAGLFILSLKWMNSPSTARQGVRAGEIGMLLRVVAEDDGGAFKVHKRARGKTCW
jgi:NAD/NADP transhydrogenase beta subunit